jgi:hypothetical protein
VFSGKAFAYLFSGNGTARIGFEGIKDRADLVVEPVFHGTIPRKERPQGITDINVLTSLREGGF